ncbi:MAG: AAA family ATPase [Pseudomonadota bacterium]
MAQVFISYSRQDDKGKTRSQAIRDIIRRNSDLQPWLDTDRTPGSRDWARLIEDEISQSALFILVLTPGVITSRFISTEIEWAKKHNVSILPVRFNVELDDFRNLTFYEDITRPDVFDVGTVFDIGEKRRFFSLVQKLTGKAEVEYDPPHRLVVKPQSPEPFQSDPRPHPPVPTPISGPAQGAVRSFVNFKGGVGKTTLCGLAGIWLARQTPAKVLLVDLDPQANLTNILIGRDRRQALTDKGRTALSLFEHFRAGRDADPRHDMHAAAISSDPFDARAFRGLPIEVLPQAEGAGRLDLLAGDRRMSKFSQADGGLHELFAHNFGLALGALQAAYDHILIDCGPTATLLSRCAFQHAAEVIAPVSAQETSTDGLVSMLADARELFGQDLGTMIRPIFNKVRWGTKFEREYVEQFFSDPTSMDEMLAPLHGKQFAELIPLAAGLTDTMRVIRKCVEKDGDLAPLGKAQAAIEAFCRQLASDEGDADRPEAHLATSAAPLNRLVASGGPAAPGSDGGKPVAMNEVLDKLTSLKSRIGNATSAVPVPKVLDIQRLIKDQFRRSSMTGGQFLDRLTDDAVRLNSLPPPPAGLHTAEVIARWLLENLSPEAAEALVRRTGDENAR